MSKSSSGGNKAGKQCRILKNLPSINEHTNIQDTKPTVYETSQTISSIMTWYRIYSPWTTLLECKWSMTTIINHQQITEVNLRQKYRSDFNCYLIEWCMNFDERSHYERKLITSAINKVRMMNESLLGKWFELLIRDHTLYIMNNGIIMNRDQ